MPLAVCLLCIGFLLLPTVASSAEHRPAITASKLDDPVDPNVATLRQLLSVPGMTPVWAERIVRFRPYSTKLQLKTQGILPPEVYQRVGPSLVVHRKAHDPK